MASPVGILFFSLFPFVCFFVNLAFRSNGGGGNHLYRQTGKPLEGSTRREAVSHGGQTHVWLPAGVYSRETRLISRKLHGHVDGLVGAIQNSESGKAMVEIEIYQGHHHLEDEED